MFARTDYGYSDRVTSALKTQFIADALARRMGGDKVHRGIVLGTLLGLTNHDVATNWFDQLVAHEAINREITALISAATAPR